MAFSSQTNQNLNLKQLFRRYTDGKLVLKNEIYDSLVGYQHIQTTPSSSWLVMHNKNSINVIAQVYINDELVDCEIIILDKCAVRLNFNDQITGKANLIFIDNPDRDPC